MAIHMLGTWETISSNGTCPAARLVTSYRGRPPNKQYKPHTAQTVINSTLRTDFGSAHIRTNLQLTVRWQLLPPM